MKGTKSAVRYAISLLELCDEQHKTDVVEKDILQILGAAQNRDFHLFINSPIISVEKKIAVFDKLFPQVDDLTRKFLRLITVKKREYEVVEIADAFIKLLKKEKGISEVELTSAVPLDEATKNIILTKIKSITLDKVELKEKIDKSLIGGFTVKVDDQMIDVSIKQQFKNLRQYLN